MSRQYDLLKGDPAVLNVNILALIAGLPRARRARGTESHTHGIWSTSFRLVVTCLTERTYVRVYRLYGWGRGDYQKEGRGVSGVSLQVLIFYIGHCVGHCQYGQLTAVKTG